MATCPHCKAEMQTDGVNSWCVQADCPADQIEDHLADCVDLDDDDDWSELMCSMGPDGQCGQAGSEWCDFECPEMAAIRAADRRKATAR